MAENGAFLCYEIYLGHRNLLSSGEFSSGTCLDQQEAFIGIFYQEGRFPSTSAFRMQTEHKGSSVVDGRIVEDCFIFPRPQLLRSDTAIPDRDNLGLCESAGEFKKNANSAADVERLPKRGKLGSFHQVVNTSDRE